MNQLVNERERSSGFCVLVIDHDEGDAGVCKGETSEHVFTECGVVRAEVSDQQNIDTYGLNASPPATDVTDI